MRLTREVILTFGIIASAVAIPVSLRVGWKEFWRQPSRGVQTSIQYRTNAEMIEEFINSGCIGRFDPRSGLVVLLRGFDQLPDHERMKVCQLCWLEWFEATDQTDNSLPIKLQDETGGTYGWYSELGGIEVNFPPKKHPR